MPRRSNFYYMPHTQNPRRRSKPAHGRKGPQSRPQAGKTNRRKQSSVDVNLLSQKAVKREVKTYEAQRRFADMPLHAALLANIAKKGYAQPTEIQDRSLEALLERRDLMGVAQTGTGKTGAFLIPLIHHLLENKGDERVLVLAPTRELAVQIEQEYRELTQGMRLKSACFIGGTNMNRDLERAGRPVALTVATPGRLLDLAQRGKIDFKRFGTLVLDEFDRMLDMGFAKDVQRITEAMTRREHTLLFSATLDPAQKPHIDRLLHKPVEVKVSSGAVTADHVDQEIIRLKEGEDKFAAFLALINQPGFEKVLVFAETKRWVSKVRKKLGQSGLQAEEIHGNKTQNYRQKALQKFKSGKVQVLVATDVAARGLDVSDVTHVINYQLPGSMDSYIHRIGRTGRAGKAGKAYTFVN